MEGEDRVTIEVHLEGSGSPGTMAREIGQGLTNTPKRLPSKYFYDARGSRLFERITELPEYYLTRAERGLLEARAHEIAELTRPVELVELGSGSARKTKLLIEAGLACGSLRRYMLVEVSREIAEKAARAVAARYPGLHVHGLIGDFEKHLGRVPDGGRRLVAFLGSTIGNFSEDEAVEFLFKIGAMIERGDWLLLGTDLVKDVELLEAAYNDSAGVTAEFNSNILRVINRRLDGDFDPAAFEHVAFYNEQESRVESYLKPKNPQKVRLDRIDLDVSFAAGEMMRTEVSCKYTRESIERLLARAGFRMAHWFTAGKQEFALSLSRLA